MKNLAADVRAWLATQDKPRTAREIFEAVSPAWPKIIPTRISVTLQNCTKAGHIVKHGEGRAATYTYVRSARVWRYATKAESAAAKKRACQRSERKRFPRTRAEYLADLRRETEARRAAKPVRTKAPVRDRPVFRASRTMPPVQMAPVPVKIAAPAPQQAETVEEWQARTGRKPEVLPTRWATPDRKVTYG